MDNIRKQSCVMAWLGYYIILVIHCILYLDVESKKVTFTEFSVKNNFASSNHEVRKSMQECLLQCERDKNCLGVKYTGNSGGNCFMANQGLISLKEAGAAIFRRQISGCTEAPKSGIYSIKLNTGKTMDVYCVERNSKMWTVIQHRQDGSVNFYRDWATYKSGFGDLNGEFWLGNDNIHELTKGGDQKLRIDMEDWEGTKYTVQYDRIVVADESDRYRVALGSYQGENPPGNAMGAIHGTVFSTYDSDVTVKGCATLFKGGWWYYGCHYANPNGEYNNTNAGAGINWEPWRGFYYSLKKMTLMIRKED